jgi:SAM-dependent methyltransferase
MHEILRRLRPADWVLDLGAAQGSFPAHMTAGRVVRADLEPKGNETQVACSADALPFAAGAFQAIICNHSVEHFEKLDAALSEIKRVIRCDGFLYVAVPDATTITDRLYRWLSHGGGHVNAFKSAAQVAEQIRSRTDLHLVGYRVLVTSFSFLNRRNIPGKIQKKLLLLGGGSEAFIVILSWILRLCDRFVGTRLSIYGWAFYFGADPGLTDLGTWTNVCARCGSGHPAEQLLQQGCVARRPLGVKMYCCPACQARNLFTRDDYVKWARLL